MPVFPIRGMRKLTVLLLISLLCPPLCASVITFTSAPHGVSFRSSVLSFNTATGFRRLTAGVLKAGSLSGDWKLAQLIDGHGALWKQHDLVSPLELDGAALSADEASLFFITKPQPGIGAALALAGFDLSFAYFPRGEADDRLILSGSERGGLESFILSAMWSNSFLTGRAKLSHSQSYGVQLMFSAGVFWKGLGLVLSQGGEANVLGRDQVAKQASVFFIETDGLEAKLEIRRFNDPVRPGAYRRLESLCEVVLSLGHARLSSQMESEFSEEGKWVCNADFRIVFDCIAMTWSKSDGPGFQFSLGPVTVSYEDGAFRFSYHAVTNWGRLSTAIGSDGSISGSLSVEFS